MKTLLFFLLITVTCNLPADEYLDRFLESYPGCIYQDIVIGDNIFPIGTDLCDCRYELLKPVLDNFEGSFSVLDLGAAQGYFSFRIAREYPLSSCVMVESNHTAYYSLHGDMLYDLCQLNSHLKNIYYLNRKMDIHDLHLISMNEHFDLVIAFLVVHLMHNELNEQIKILKTLLKLSDNLIIEIANDVGVIHSSYVEYLSDSLEATYLGEVNRHKDSNSKSKGKLFWFKKNNDVAEINRNKDTPLHRTTYELLNGVFPETF